MTTVIPVVQRLVLTGLSAVSPDTPIRAPATGNPIIPEIPYLAGLTTTAAENALIAVGLVPVLTSQFSDTVAVGLIVSQSPAGGAPLVAGESVAIVASLGPIPKIPSVVGEATVAAENALIAVSLVPVLTYQYSTTVAAGLIVSQSPAAGGDVVAGESVVLVQSLGAITVPSIVGLSPQAAAIALGSVGLAMGSVASAISATVGPGLIISQSPAAGTLAASGELVSFTLSAGYAAVPDVIGLSLAAAEAALAADGFTVGSVTAESSDPPTGFIAGSAPTGSQPPGTPINLVVTQPPPGVPVTGLGTIQSDLFSYLHRVFRKDAAPFLALRITCVGGLTWTLAAQTLTLTPAVVVGGVAAPLTLDLSAYTVASLAQYLAGQPGYSVAYQDTTVLSQLSALVLIDGAGDTSVSNGDHFYGYTNLLWSYVAALASELSLAQSEIVNMLAQMSTTTASNEFLDLLGTYYDVTRGPGELDSAYSPGIIANVLLPSCNNVGMAVALQSLFPGTTAVITDVLGGTGTLLLRDGTVFFDSEHVHNELGFGIPEGLFDVVFAFDFDGPIGESAYLPLLIAAINRYRAAGTYIRNISMKNGLSASVVTATSTVGFISVSVYG